MGYNKDMLDKLEIICNQFYHLLQEGVILSFDEKEKMLKLIRDLELIVKDFDTA